MEFKFRGKKYRWNLGKLVGELFTIAIILFFMILLSVDWDMTLGI